MQRKLLSLTMAALLAIPIIPAIPASPAQAQCFEGDWGIQGCGNFGNGGYNNDYGGRRRHNDGWGNRNPHRNWGNGGNGWGNGGYERPRRRDWDRPRFRNDNGWDRPRYREERRRPRWQHRSDNGYEDNNNENLALAALASAYGASLIVGTLLNQPDTNYQRPADFNPEGRVYDETDLTCRWITYTNRSVRFLESGESWKVSTGNFCMPSPTSKTALYRLQNGRATEVQFLN